MRRILSEIEEEAYDGNLGFQEMVLFYRSADSKDIGKMEKFLRDKKFKSAWNLLKKVTGVALRTLR